MCTVVKTKEGTFHVSSTKFSHFFCSMLSFQIYIDRVAPMDVVSGSFEGKKYWLFLIIELVDYI